MRIEPLGDRAYILRDLPNPAHLVAEAIRGACIKGVLETNACYNTVGVYRGEDHIDLQELEAAAQTRIQLPQRSHCIPVCYELGDDLQEAAQQLHLTPQKLIRIHAEGSYQVAAIGFCPGFPYLTGLPDALCGLARRSSPRIRVPAGSVAITGAQAGIYPSEHPGGWWLLGRTPLAIADEPSDYFPLQAGDLVRFEPIDRATYQAQQGDRL